MRGAYVTVCESPDQVILLYKNKPQPYKTFDKNNKPQEAVSGKDVNARIDKRTISKKPRPDHPRYGNIAS
jgi:hypothetical protein